MKLHQILKQVLKGIIKAVVCAMISFPGWAGNAVGQEALLSQEAAVENDGATQTTIWYFTLRNKIEGRSGNEFYGGMRSELRAGCFYINFVPIPGLKEIAETSPFYLPGERIILQGVDELPETEMFRKIKGFANDHQGKVVIYIHGYNVGFEKGCRQAAIFQRALGERHRVVMFSWPADGDILKYTRDEADMEWSVPQMANVITRLVQVLGMGKIDVVAHSLGARGMVAALTRMACADVPESFINELVLLAPDIDRDGFREAWPDLKPLARHTTLYISENDKALKLSSKVHGYARLGEAGEFTTLLPGIDTIDVSLLFNRRPSGHLYHLYTAEAISDLTMLINTGKPSNKRPNLQQEVLDGLFYWKLLPNAP